MPEQFNYKKENTEQESAVLAYLIEKNKTLQNDYKTLDGAHSESCSLIAMDIARLLIKEGKKPSIVSIRGKEVDAHGIISNTPLSPIQYGGRVTWGGHTVCVCNGLAYDPMLTKPTPINTYIQNVFGAEVEVKTMVGEDEIIDFAKE